ncbi:unnamed protein product [Phaeothamnion confervicola]
MWSLVLRFVMLPLYAIFCFRCLLMGPQAWDANAMLVALEFPVAGKVFAAAMSQALSAHSLIAAGCDEAQVRLCDLTSGSFAQMLPGHGAAVWAVQWSPTDPFLLATGSEDRSVRLWDVRRSGASACLISLDRHPGEDSGGPPQPASAPWHNEEEEAGNAAGSGASAASGIAAVAAAAMQRVGAGGSAGIRGGGCVDSDSRNGVGGGRSDRDGGGVGERSAKSYRSSHAELPPHVSRASAFAQAHVGAVNSLTFTPSGSHLLTSGMDGRLRLWDVSSGENMLTNYLGTKSKQARPFRMAVAAPSGDRRSMLFFPNGAGRGGADVLVYPVHTRDGQPISTLRGHVEPVQCCAYRPNTQELVTGGFDSLVLLWSYRSRLSPAQEAAAAADASGVAAAAARTGGDEVDWSSSDEEDGVAATFVPPILRMQGRRAMPG